MSACWLSSSTSTWYWPCSLPRDENSTNRGRHSPRRRARRLARAAVGDQVRLQLHRELRRGRSAGMPRSSILMAWRPPAARGSKPLMCKCGFCAEETWLGQACGRGATEVSCRPLRSLLMRSKLEGAADACAWPFAHVASPAPTQKVQCGCSGLLHFFIANLAAQSSTSLRAFGPPRRAKVFLAQLYFPKNIRIAVRAMLSARNTSAVQRNPRRFKSKLGTERGIAIQSCGPRFP
jgi:hypothetical protein